MKERIQRLFFSILVARGGADIYSTLVLHPPSYDELPEEDRPNRPTRLAWPRTVAARAVQWAKACSRGLSRSERHLVIGLVIGLVADRVLFDADHRPPDDPGRRSVVRAGVLIGTVSQRMIGRAVRSLGMEHVREIVHEAEHDPRLRGTWAVPALIGAWVNETVGHALAAALPGARVRRAPLNQDAFRATDFIVTFPGAHGGLLVQVKAASSGELPIYVSARVSGPAPPVRERRKGETAYGTLEGISQIRRAAQSRRELTKAPWYGVMISLSPQLLMRTTEGYVLPLRIALQGLAPRQPSETAPKLPADDASPVLLS